MNRHDQSWKDQQPKKPSASMDVLGLVAVVVLIWVVMVAVGACDNIALPR